MKPLSFRSLQDALAAARDGDRIVMQLGHHNVGGTAADVRVRVLIRCAWAAVCDVALGCAAADSPAPARSGEGELGDTILEQRANAPLLRLLAPAVVQNLVLDMCGFRECVSAEGDARCTPLLEACRIRCSGDHAVVCAGTSAATLRGCEIGSRKAGLLSLDAARPCLQD